MKALTTLFVVGMFATTVAMADDVDDVKASEMEHFAARGGGDAGTVVQHHLPGHTSFVSGELLSRSDSLEDERNNLQAQFDAGFKTDAQPRHFEVKVYGNTAVTTCYMVGTQTLPDGTTHQVNSQRTAVLIKQGGQWKEVHVHVSPLMTPSPQ